MTPAQYAKAVVGAAIAGLGALGTALTDGHVSGSEWLVVASTTLVALGGVFGVPNAPSAKQSAANELAAAAEKVASGILPAVAHSGVVLAKAPASPIVLGAADVAADVPPDAVPEPE